MLYKLKGKRIVQLAGTVQGMSLYKHTRTFDTQRLSLIYRTYEQLAKIGIDFGRLLESKSTEEENFVAPAVSRSNSCRASCTSLSSVGTNKIYDGDAQEEPTEVINARVDYLPRIHSMVIFIRY